jgi:hypothetical protein
VEAPGPGDAPTSDRRFADGSQVRIEIPSTEGPEALEAVIDEATRRGVPVHRVGQGRGVMLLTHDELQRHSQTTVKSRCHVSAVKSHDASLRFTWLVPQPRHKSSNRA